MGKRNKESHARAVKRLRMEGKPQGKRVVPKKKKKVVKKEEEKEVIYSGEEKILLVGEGDFSFTKSLLDDEYKEKGFLMVSTIYDTEEEMKAKYVEGEAHIDYLRKHNVVVLDSVDASQLDQHPDLRDRQFDKIVFQFPHRALGIKDQDRNIESNQQLLYLYFQTAERLLKDNTSEIHVTLRTGMPYDKWNVVGMAHGTGTLERVRAVSFHPSHYPGYCFRRTKANAQSREGNEFYGRKCKTFIFRRKPS